MRLARVLGVIGRALMWTGAIVLLFVGYQLWGTSLAEARAQDDLESEFEDLLADTTTTTSPSTTTEAPGPTTTTRPAPTTTAAPPPPPDDGEAVARLVIPAIGMDKIVVEGVGRRDLQKGPGHYPGTPLPGQPGNSAIAGHRTTYGAPFHRVDELEPGDEIIATTLQGSFTYEVFETRIVTPAEVEVIQDFGDDRLTLTSCHPKYSAAKRIIIFARLVDEPAPAPPPPADDAPDQDVLPDEGDESDEDDEDDEDDVLVDEGDEGAGDEADEEIDAPGAVDDLESLEANAERPVAPVVLWGAVAFAVWLAFYALSRAWRRWPAYLLGAPVFLVALFVFFEALAELLPAEY